MGIAISSISDAALQDGRNETAIHEALCLSAFEGCERLNNNSLVRIEE
jgi:hypothetical protein